MKKFLSNATVKIALTSAVLMLINALLILTIVFFIQKNVAIGITRDDFCTYVENAAEQIHIREQMITYEDDFTFVHNNVSLLILEEDGMVVAGRYPVISGVEIGPPVEGIREVTLTGGEFYVYDTKIPGSITDEAIWVRGMESVIYAENDAHFLFALIRIIAPIFIVLSAIISFIIARSAIRPIEESYNREKLFTSNISHELRTPLSVIKSTTEYLETYADDPAEYKDGIKTIKNASDKMQFMTQNLLTLSRSEQTKELSEIESFDFRFFLEDILKDPELHEANITISEMPPVSVSANRGLLQEAFYNLFSNVIKYGGQKATVSVHIHSTYLSLTLRDFGEGIPHEQIGKIFDPFYRVDGMHRSHDGFGLGLPLAKRIIEAHKGSLKASNHPDGGAEFIVTLPL